MKVLIATASRHGSTAEIGRRVGDRLAATGFDVEVSAAESVSTVEPYDAVIIGSGIYAGTWLKGARLLIERNSIPLRERLVWLFSSGPVGEIKGKPVDDEQVAMLTERSGAQGHTVFSGKLDRGALNLAEKGIVRLLKVADGDFRDWESIDLWAADIAGHLVPV